MFKTYMWSGALMLVLACPGLAIAQTAAPKSAEPKAPASIVNLNTASPSDLEALPGVGPATAKKIIAGRPYSSVAELTKAGVPKSTIEKITAMVTVGTGAPAPTAQTAPQPSRVPAPTPPPPTNPPATNAPSATQQPPVKGMVWVNLPTKVFHREGDRYYGNTKSGKFMTEADAIAAGYHEAKTGKKPTK